MAVCRPVVDAPQDVRYVRRLLVPRIWCQQLVAVAQSFGEVKSLDGSAYRPATAPASRDLVLVPYFERDGPGHVDGMPPGRAANLVQWFEPHRTLADCSRPSRRNPATGRRYDHLAEFPGGKTRSTSDWAILKLRSDVDSVMAWSSGELRGAVCTVIRNHKT